ncbi:unnamed protein product [Caretta caretta]
MQKQGVTKDTNSDSFSSFDAVPDDSQLNGRHKRGVHVWRITHMLQTATKPTPTTSHSKALQETGVWLTRLSLPLVFKKICCKNYD